MNLLDPNSFIWEEAPLSSFYAVAITSIGYVVLVVLSTFLSRKFRPILDDNNNNNNNTEEKKIQNKNENTTGLQWKPWFHSDLKNLQFIHNVNLVVGSAIMLYGVTIESYRRIIASGGGIPDDNHDHHHDDSSPSTSLTFFGTWPPFLFCESPDISPSGPLYYWTYVYYLSKYYELFDTLLQLARGKPPPHFTLHVYHHAVVLLMAWGWCEYQQSLHFIGLAFNTAVHIVMYTYFLQRTITGRIPKWKSFVTLFQIIQFFCSFLCTLYTLYIVFIQKYTCAGMIPMYLNVLFNVTLFFSFIGVFKSGNKKKKKKKKKSKKVE